MSENIVLDRFEYKLPKDMFVIYKTSIGFKYKLKHSKQEFETEDKVLAFIEKALKERKRYLQLLKTLSVSELSKLFSDIVLLGLTPAQLREYEIVEQFEYTLVVDDDWGSSETRKQLWEIKDVVGERVGVFLHGDFDLVCNEDKVVVQSC